MVIMPTFSKVEGVWGAARCGEPESVVNCAPRGQEGPLFMFFPAPQGEPGAEGGGARRKAWRFGPRWPQRAVRAAPDSGHQGASCLLSAPLPWGRPIASFLRLVQVITVQRAPADSYIYLR
jgi:hypothetical protein